MIELAAFLEATAWQDVGLCRGDIDVCSFGRMATQTADFHGSLVVKPLELLTWIPVGSIMVWVGTNRLSCAPSAMRRSVSRLADQRPRGPPKAIMKAEARIKSRADLKLNQIVEWTRVARMKNQHTN